EKFKILIENRKVIPQWISVEEDKYKGKVMSLPSKDDLNVPFNETLIVEFYSK
ncbi:30S ribosomal protein S4, partial [Candidatus Arthromitus sp. SFB-2]